MPTCNCNTITPHIPESHSSLCDARPRTESDPAPCCPDCQAGRPCIECPCCKGTGVHRAPNSHQDDELCRTCDGGGRIPGRNIFLDATGLEDGVCIEIAFY